MVTVKKKQTLQLIRLFQAMIGRRGKKFATKNPAGRKLGGRSFMPARTAPHDTKKRHRRLVAAKWIGTGPFMRMPWISLDDIGLTLPIRFIYLFVVRANRFFLCLLFFWNLSRLVLPSRRVSNWRAIHGVTLGMHGSVCDEGQYKYGDNRRGNMRQ